MTVDDTSSQDSAVIDDDLVEALGFEPVTAVAPADHSDSSSPVLNGNGDTAESRVEGFDDEPVDPPSNGSALFLEDDGFQINGERELLATEAGPDDAVLDDAVLDDAVLDDAPAADDELATHRIEALVASMLDNDDTDGTDSEGDDGETEHQADMTHVDARVETDEPDALEPPEALINDDAQHDVDLIEGLVEDQEGEAEGLDAEISDLDSADDELMAEDDASIALLADGETESVDLDRIDTDLEVGDAELEGTQLEGTQLEGSEFEGTELEGTEFEGSDAEADAALTAPVDPVMDLAESDASMLRSDVDLFPDVSENDAAADLGLATPASVFADTPTGPPPMDQTAVVPVTAAQPAQGRRLRRRRKLRARKSRRVIRHIDPWSVLTFSVLFHMCVFAALLLSSVLVWNAAIASGMVENLESFIQELGDYETFEINADVMFKAAVIVAGMLTLASSVLVVLLTVVFNLISDLVGGIRVTVIEEETVRIPVDKKRVKADSE